MNVLAIIPARGGSKGLPRKNLVPLAGRPLVAHTIAHARAAALVDRVVVSTDDEAIAAVARAEQAQAVRRPAELSGDESPSETALLHVLDTLAQQEDYHPDLVVFLQCTSPIRREEDVDAAIVALREHDADSLLSVVRAHRFLWRRTDDGPEPVNYDFRSRPRRQDRAPEFVENGSIYVLKPWVLRDLGNRLGGRIALYEMDYWSQFDIDGPEDVRLCEWILARTAATP